MEKYFCNYNQSLALKELGFDEPCLKTMLDFDITYESNIKMPLKSQVFEWFRKQGYDTKVEKEREGLYFGFYWTGLPRLMVII